MSIQSPSLHRHTEIMPEWLQVMTWIGLFVFGIPAFYLWSQVFNHHELSKIENITMYALSFLTFTEAFLLIASRRVSWFAWLLGVCAIASFIGMIIVGR